MGLTEDVPAPFRLKNGKVPAFLRGAKFYNPQADSEAAETSSCKNDGGSQAMSSIGTSLKQLAPIKHKATSSRPHDALLGGLAGRPEPMRF